MRRWIPLLFLFLSITGGGGYLKSSPISNLDTFRIGGNKSAQFEIGPTAFQFRFFF